MTPLEAFQLGIDYARARRLRRRSSGRRDPGVLRRRREVIAWRYTVIGVVAHAVRTDGTNRAIGSAFCGRTSADGRWHYGPHFGSRECCLRCRQAIAAVRTPESSNAK